MRILAGLIGAIVAALLVVWLMNHDGCTMHHTSATFELAPASAPAQPSFDTPPPEAASKPAPEPAPALPELPPYLKIVETLDGATAKVDAMLSASNAIDLKTSGVRRVRLLRAEWPQPVTSSIAVRIDGQGIEWTGKRDVLELQRSDNGDWAIVPPAAPAKPDRP